MKKRGNNVTERLVDSSIVGFVINDNGYHYHCQWFFGKYVKNFLYLFFEKKKEQQLLLFFSIDDLL